MKLAEAGYLLDVNVLVALALGDHPHNSAVTQWFATKADESWGTCVLTQAGFLRVLTNPRVGSKSIERSKAALAVMEKHPHHRYWPITDSCNSLIEPISERLFGHQQLTDALLLGLAVKENGILVTMDRAIRHLAGPRYKDNILVLEP